MWCVVLVKELLKANNSYVYANGGNRLDDSVVGCPLRVLWVRYPGQGVPDTLKLRLVKCIVWDPALVPSLILT